MASSRMTGRLVALMAVIATMIAPSATAADLSADRLPALPRGGRDVSETVTGRQLIRRAAERNPVLRASGRLRAVRDAEGYTVAPADTRYTTYRVELDNRTSGIALAPLTQVDRPGGGTPGADDAATVLPSTSWSRVGERCFARISDTWAWMDHCYHLYRETNDGSSSFDYYALKRFATMGRNAPWTLWDGRIRATRSGGASQTWFDWSPRSDWEGGACTTVTVSITLPIAGVSEAVERCPERWVVYKSANGTQPDYHLTWEGHTTSAREVAFVISVRVAQGGTPVWGVPASVHGGL